jgi:hypothetical protein
LSLKQAVGECLIFLAILRGSTDIRRNEPMRQSQSPPRQLRSPLQ